jgi:hypothetical protein
LAGLTSGYVGLTIVSMVKETKSLRDLRLRWASYLRHYGEADPRTVAVSRALLIARAAAAQAEADRFRAQADALAVAP